MKSYLKDTIILFDLDGTLLHTAPTFVMICNRILETKGYSPITLDIISKDISYGVKAMMKASFEHHGYTPSDSEIEELAGLFFQLYTQDMVTGTQAYPHVQDVLEQLSAWNVRMAVVTNKTQDYADQLIDTFGWRKYFPVVKGPSEGAKKPDPNHIYGALQAMGLPKDTPCILVGDSPVDWNAAKNANIPFMFHESGYKDQTTIETPFTFSDYKDFLSVLDQCFTVNPLSES